MADTNSTSGNTDTTTTSPSVLLLTTENLKTSPSKWLADPTAAAVHDAFLLGWKIFELKSRIQIEVFRHVVRVKSGKSGLDDTNMEDVMKTATNLIKVLLPQVRPHNIEQEARALLTNAKDSLSKASEWRSIFTQIATLHNNRFPESNLSNSYFDLLKDQAPQDLLPYLYPQTLSAGSDDFADVGISKVDSKKQPLLPDFTIFEITRRLLNCLNLLYTKPGESLLPGPIVGYQGQLLKIINRVKPLALTSSPTRVNMMLVANSNQPTTQTMKVCQEGSGSLNWQATSSADWLTLSVNSGTLDHDNNTAPITLTVDTSKIEPGKNYVAEITLTAADQSAVVPVNVTYLAQQQTQIMGEEVELADESHYDAICLLSGLAVRFLEAWDNYLSEHYYTGGSINNDETEMMAYEAGRAIAELSWGISVSLEKLQSERQLAVIQKNQNSVQDCIAYYQKLYAAWQSNITKRKVVHVQHQISALSTVLNDAYFRVTGTTPSKQPDTQGVPLDPSLPGTAIHSIKHSLDFWQRAIDWFGSENGMNWMKYDVAHQLNVDPDSVQLPAFSENISRRLQVSLIQQADTWQALLTFQQSLRDFSNQSITQKIINDFMNDFEVAVAKEIKTSGKKIAKATTPPIWLIAILVIAILVVGGVLVAAFISGSATSSLVGLMVATLTAGGGAYAVKNTTQPNSETTTSTNGNTGTTNVATTTSSNGGTFGQIKSLFVATESSIADTFRRGYEQVQTEFASLNYHISVAYPLVEFFVLNLTDNAATAMAKAAQTKIDEIKQPATATTNSTATTNTTNTGQSAGEQVKSAAEFSMTSAYDFLTKIIWSEEERKDEIQRVTRAAFGPIGGFVGAAFAASDSETDDSDNSKK